MTARIQKKRYRRLRNVRIPGAAETDVGACRLQFSEVWRRQCTLLVRGAVDTDQLQVPDRRRVCIRGVVLKKKWGGALETRLRQKFTVT